MIFQVLSHAGLLIRNEKGTSLICDPWLLGSCYWRSWWNYPPVSPELVKSLKPDYIYLTHIHWDHFHGDSLAKFSKETKIIVPKGNYSRMRDDLNYLGYYNVIELNDGESFLVDTGFEITSYQFWMFLDSALLIKCDGITLLNLNDAKFMGAPLQRIVKKHKPIDFAFRSHSSANERLSYEIVDDKDQQVDDLDNYIREFANTVRATGARYAIPFASNHCHLHKDSFHFNEHIQHPKLVKQYFVKHNILTPQLQTMVSGDQWSSIHGFNISNKDWYDDRNKLLNEYLDENAESLSKFYALEDKTVISKNVVDQYFSDLSRSLPFFVKRYFKNLKFTYVLKTADVPRYVYNIDVAKGTVEEISSQETLDHTRYPIQIHTTAFIFLRAIEYKIFSHMCIGKRVFYKVTKYHKKYMEALNLIFNCYEYDLLPLRKNFTSRAIASWFSRWREVILYILLAKDRFVYGKLNLAKYLKPIEK